MDTSAMSVGRFATVTWTEVTGSTNADLTAQAAQSPDIATVLLTDLQTAGRGRRDRTWEMTPGGGLLISFYVPWTASDTAHLVPTALGVAAVDAVSSVDCSVGLKWPNDLVTPDGLKVGGMLGNVVTHQGVPSGVVVGLGCNVSWPAADQVGLEHATCLERLRGSPIDRERLAAGLIRGFDAELTKIESLGPAALHERYRSRCLTIGVRVRVEQATGSLEGVATDIDQSGALLLDIDGVQRRVDVGDVVHLRPI